MFEGASRIVIIAPFITQSGLKPLLQVLPSDCDITIYTRWRAQEVALGVSDPGILDLIDARGRIFLCPILHAKVYLRPGVGALVGSANVTVPGMGWEGEGSLEALVEVAADHPMIVSLLAFLENHSFPATQELALQIRSQAKSLDKVPPVPADSLPKAIREPWLPTYDVPNVLWHVYQGEWDPDVMKLARPVLEALAPPPGLTEAQFKAYVADLLLQGFPGQVANRLKGLSSYQAITQLEKIAQEAGLTLDHPESAWNRLIAWLTYFLPNRFQTTKGGKALRR